AIWHLSKKWNLTAFAPLYLSGDYAATDNVTVHVRTGPTGNVYRFSNENQVEFAGKDDVVYLRIFQWKTTGEIEWRASKDVALMAEVGTIRTIKFAFADNAKGDDPFFDDSTKQAPYARFAVRFRFGKTILDEWKP